MSSPETKRVKLVIDKSSTPKTHRPQKEDKSSEVKPTADTSTTMYLKVPEDIELEVTNSQNEKQVNSQVQVAAGPESMEESVSVDAPKISSTELPVSLDKPLEAKETPTTVIETGTEGVSTPVDSLTPQASNEKESAQRNIDQATLIKERIADDFWGDSEDDSWNVTSEPEVKKEPKRHGCLVSILCWVFAAVIAVIYGDFKPFDTPSEGLIIVAALIMILLFFAPIGIFVRWLFRLGKSESPKQKESDGLGRRLLILNTAFVIVLVGIGLFLNNLLPGSDVQPLNLDSAYSYAGVNIKYPSSWQKPVEFEGGFYIATNSSSMGMLQVAVSDSAMAEYSNEDTLRKNLKNFWDSSDMSYVTTEDTQVETYVAEKATFVLELNGEKFYAYGLNFYTETKQCVIIAAASPSELEDKATMKAIIETVSFSE